MKQKRADKKNIFTKNRFSSWLLKLSNRFIITVFNGLFRVYRMDSTHTAAEYFAGLLRCEKGHENIERMTEKVEDSDYKRYIHFFCK